MAHSKSLAREFSLHFFYQAISKTGPSVFNCAEYDISDTELNEFQSHFSELHQELKLTKKDKNLANQLIYGVSKNFENILGLINGHSKGGKIEKISSIDSAILLLSTHELANLETPLKVVMDEYINLSKKYSEKNTYSFINGVLDAIAKEVRN
jgi:transcription antitermination protein NusB